MTRNKTDSSCPAGPRLRLSVTGSPVERPAFVAEPDPLAFFKGFALGATLSSILWAAAVIALVLTR